MFTRQMAALYCKEAWPGHDVALDMNYTDIGKTYRIVLGENGSRVEEEPALRAASAPCALAST